ncbi:hypothetical protein MMC24_000286 [Lignoscripta atroalba]|nr:hypothetical protein [Lignoscripta atroalba]
MKRDNGNEAPGSFGGYIESQVNKTPRNHPDWASQINRASSKRQQPLITEPDMDAPARSQHPILVLVLHLTDLTTSRMGRAIREIAMAETVSARPAASVAAGVQPPPLKPAPCAVESMGLAETGGRVLQVP